MTEEMEDLLDTFSEQGNEEMENENYIKAIEYFYKALDILPEPVYITAHGTVLLSPGRDEKCNGIPFTGIHARR